MWSLLTLISGALAAVTPATDSSRSGWKFVEKGSSGVLALEAIVVSPTLVLIFDRATNDPLEINGHPAWGALWNLKTNKATALDVVTDSFCASGALLSNGSMVWPSLGEISNFDPNLPRSASGVTSPYSRKPATETWQSVSSSLVQIRMVLDARFSRTQKHTIWQKRAGTQPRSESLTGPWSVALHPNRLLTYSF